MISGSRHPTGDGRSISAHVPPVPRVLLNSGPPHGNDRYYMVFKYHLVFKVKLVFGFLDVKRDQREVPIIYGGYSETCGKDRDAHGRRQVTRNQAGYAVTRFLCAG